jgi:histidyl-tRNA synthetase
MMAADTMEALGIPRGSYVVKVNNRKVLDGVRQIIGVGDDEQWLTVMRAIDKYDRLGIYAVRELLGDGRKDESGDFTKGAGLTPEQINGLMGPMFYVGSETFPLVARELATDAELKVPSVDGSTRHHSNFESLKMVRQLFSNEVYSQGRTSEVLVQGLEELNTIVQLCDRSGYGPDRIRYDASVVRGLEYYTGPVYEVELTLETKDEKGRPVRFGSVGGGGRYDGLISRFRGEPVPATGFSIGVSRLQAALTMLGKLDTKPEFGPVVVTVFDRDRVADYQKMVASLRNEKIRAELYLGNPKNMGNQLKYADRRNSPCVIIQGSDEKDDPAGPQVLLKDLILGAELAKLEKDREEYLQKQGEAQTKVPQASLVEEVRKILDKHSVKWN